MWLTEISGDLISFIAGLSPSEAFILLLVLTLGGGNLGTSILNAIRSKNTYNQTVPNHGSSLRDAIDRISETVEKNSYGIEELKNNFEHERKHSEQYREMLEGRISMLEKSKNGKNRKIINKK